MFTAAKRPSDSSFRYAFAETLADTAFVAAGDQSIAAIPLGSDRARSLGNAHQILPDGALLISDASMTDVVDALARLAWDPGTTLSLPLDPHGSPIDLAVWDAFCAVPACMPTTHGTIAVPCHRVLKADGSVTGYRLGVHRKRRLLAMEAAA